MDFSIGAVTMSLDNDENEYFSDEAEAGKENGEEQSNRTFRMMVLGMIGIGALGVIVIALFLVGRQGQRDSINAQNQAIQATNTAIAMLSQITPTPPPTDTPEPTNVPAPTATSRPAPTNTPAPKDIVDTALSDSNFKTLANALKAAGLVDALKADGPFTIFAPSDAAFAKLPAGTLDALL